MKTFNRYNLVIFAMAGMTVVGVCAKELPGLYEIANKGGSYARDYNVLVEHIQELERKVAGMQKQITLLHATKQDKAH